MKTGMTKRRFWRIVATTAAALCLVFALAGCGQQSSSETSDAQGITISLGVDGTMGDRGLIFDEDINLEEGSSVYDALLASELDLELDQSSSSPYITGIGGLTNADGTANSGWLFTVNGEMPAEGAADVVLADGDIVTWTWWLDAMDAFSDSGFDTEVEG